MSVLRLLLYLLLGVVAFMILSVVVTTALAVLSMVWALATLITTLALFGALGYGVYRLVMLASGNSTSQSEPFDLSINGSSTTRNSADIEPQSRVDRIKEKYANGELSESEMERLLEQEMDRGERELQRDRI